ncbi:kinase-like protein [Basidiobolus meristosporus CBS 931.73]|uniref:non-specific serine/threonine protein kinase n=1 Tax=Basidiobolus meristosporus CBS 931.73 TaxID=1314790 RepID=A0A1Y1Y9Y8_9FUNG|nr:kinase-like protein [Basidiobolus meristosporus CBS 931.73]|eukprot:ORX94829.1 kinase-like protein [Basidiobolus meristosporus CBS 931.73]
MVLLGTCNMLILSSTLAGCSFSTATLFATRCVMPMEMQKVFVMMQSLPLLREVKHPNLVYIEEYVHDAARELLYIVMEYCGHRDLAFFIKEFRENSCTNIGVEKKVVECGQKRCGQCRALVSFAVTNGCLSDIKPESVFITADNNYKLGDFGLYRSLAQRSVACSFVGEMFQNQPYSNKVDIWALGLLLYELRCIKHLFHANKQEELLKQMKLKPPPEIPLIYPQSMLRLLRRMLDPEVIMLISNYLKREEAELQRLYKEALAEGGKIAVFSGGDLPNAGSDIVRALESKCPGTMLNLTTDFSKHEPEFPASLKAIPTGKEARFDDKVKKRGLDAYNGVDVLFNALDRVEQTVKSWEKSNLVCRVTKQRGARIFAAATMESWHGAFYAKTITYKLFSAIVE